MIRGPPCTQSSSMKTLVMLFSLPLIIIKAVEGGAAEKELHEVLFHGNSTYNTDVRPRKNPSETVEVYVEYELISIQELNESRQVLSTVGFFTTVWRDDYLTWDPSLFNGIEVMVVHPNTVWLPDFGIGNSADTFYHAEFTRDFRAKLHHNGIITWSFGGTFHTMCILDNTYYPFDIQKCTIKLENWAYTGEEVELFHRKNHLDVGSYHTHGIWDLLSTEVDKHYLVFESHPNESFPELDFTMTLRRKPTYYVLNIMAPCALILFVALAVYWLPPESGEKVSFGVTVLLAFSVFQLVINEQMPINSDYKPKLSLLVVSIMGLSSFSVFMSILVLYFYHKGSATRVPRWIRYLMFRCVAKILCMKTSMPQVDDVETSVAPKPSFGSVEDLEGNENNHNLNIKTQEENKELKDILKCIQYIKEKMQAKEKSGAIIIEWQALARVIDRFLFWLSLITIIIILATLYSDKPDIDHSVSNNTSHNTGH